MRFVSVGDKGHDLKIDVSRPFAKIAKGRYDVEGNSYVVSRPFAESAKGRYYVAVHSLSQQCR